jgi:uncharacterized caspase-like protein
MNKVVRLSVVLAVLISACTVAPTTKLQTDDKRACAQNYTYDGSFFAGRTFKTHDFVDGVSKSAAVENAAKELAKQGWAVANMNTDLGIISASQTVSFGEGKTAPLSVVIDKKNKGVDIAI